MREVVSGLLMFCGNGDVEFGEACDDGNLANGDGCSSTCEIEPPAVCGNGVIESGEECDGVNLGGETCNSIFGCSGGLLLCNNDCTFDDSSCSGCCTAVGESCNNDGDCCSGNCSNGPPASRVCQP